jgi:hypothetical protein
MKCEACEGFGYYFGMSITKDVTGEVISPVCNKCFGSGLKVTVLDMTYKINNLTKFYTFPVGIMNVCGFAYGLKYKYDKVDSSVIMHILTKGEISFRAYRLLMCHSPKNKFDVFKSRVIDKVFFKLELSQIPFEIDLNLMFLMPV